MKLPNGSRADLGVKLEDYVLNPLHCEGKHKAHVFASVLGITLANVQVLRNALLDAAASSDQVEPRGDNGFGEFYIYASIPARYGERHGYRAVRMDHPPWRRLSQADNLLYRLIYEYPISSARCRRVT